MNEHEDIEVLNEILDEYKTYNSNQNQRSQIQVQSLNKNDEYSEEESINDDNFYREWYG